MENKGLTTEYKEKLSQILKDEGIVAVAKHDLASTIAHTGYFLKKAGRITKYVLGRGFYHFARYMCMPLIGAGGIGSIIQEQNNNQRDIRRSRGELSADLNVLNYHMRKRLLELPEIDFD